MSGETEEFAVITVYAGPSLHSKDVDPVEVQIDFDILDALWASDPAAWAALLHFVEEDLRNDHA